MGIFVRVDAHDLVVSASVLVEFEYPSCQVECGVRNVCGARIILKFRVDEFLVGNPRARRDASEFRIEGRDAKQRSSVSDDR